MRTLTIKASAEEIAEAYGVARIRSRLHLVEDLGPDDRVYCVHADAGQRVLETFRWGFGEYGLHLAQLERISHRDVWEEAYRLRRCVIPCTSLAPSSPKYEAFVPGLGENRFLAVAGVYDARARHSGAVAAITIPNNNSVWKLKRMPLILPDNLIDIWLQEGLEGMNALKEKFYNHTPTLVPILPAKGRKGKGQPRSNVPAHPTECHQRSG
jgi:putative SOS response-associated peptidase YedK